MQLASAQRTVPSSSSPPCPYPPPPSPHLPQEIGAYGWHYINDLPATIEEANQAYLSSTGTKHRFFMVRGVCMSNSRGPDPCERSEGCQCPLLPPTLYRPALLCTTGPAVYPAAAGMDPDPEGRTRLDPGHWRGRQQRGRRGVGRCCRVRRETGEIRCEQQGRGATQGFTGRGSSSGSRRGGGRAVALGGGGGGSRSNSLWACCCCCRAFWAGDDGELPVRPGSHHALPHGAELSMT